MQQRGRTRRLRTIGRTRRRWVGSLSNIVDERAASAPSKGCVASGVAADAGSRSDAVPLLGRRRGPGPPSRRSHPGRDSRWTPWTERMKPPARSHLGVPRSVPRSGSQQVLSGPLQSTSDRENPRDFFEPTMGFEPTTCGLRNRCSTPELGWRSPKRGGGPYHPRVLRQAVRTGCGSTNTGRRKRRADPRASGPSGLAAGWPRSAGPRHHVCWIAAIEATAARAGPCT